MNEVKLNWKLSIFLKRNFVAIFLAIVPPIALWCFLQRETPSLAVQTTSLSSVISVDNKFSDGVEVVYRNRRVKSLFVANIQPQSNWRPFKHHFSFKIPSLKNRSAESSNVPNLYSRGNRRNIAGS